MKESIFVVEDNPVYLKIVTTLIRENGYAHVYGFSSGEECLDNLHKKPSVILLDIGLSRLNGIDILKQVRQKSKSSKVIMLTGQGDEEVINKCLRAGAYDYIIKENESLEKIKKTLRKIKLLTWVKSISMLLVFALLVAVIIYILG